VSRRRVLRKNILKMLWNPPQDPINKISGIRQIKKYNKNNKLFLKNRENIYFKNELFKMNKIYIFILDKL
jgi:hypothetical protein